LASIRPLNGSGKTAKEESEDSSLPLVKRQQKGAQDEAVISASSNPKHDRLYPCWVRNQFTPQ
jgi:hypothetical protein|tara:strand:- start:561 stop:749 length:189 start_codon:yes stop_codon:yes gene_type:complete